MKHEYTDTDTDTDTQLQAAIDGSCDKLAQSSRMYLNALDLDNTTENWTGEAPARLDLIKSALASLPEPEPPKVDGKTPGEFYSNLLSDSAPDVYYTWSEMSSEMRAEMQSRIAAVLAAFGNQSQPAKILWIEWHGGDCPLKDEEVEEWEYKFRQRPSEVTKIARKSNSTPNEMFWGHDGSYGDIIAYRVLKWREGCEPLVVDHKVLAADEWAERWQSEADARNRQLRELECTRSIAEKALAELAKTKKNGLPQLRPLSEAGEVPEGCVRYYTYKKDGEWTTATKHRAMQDTHFFDTYLPAPVEKPDPYAELKKAHAAGKVIQFKPYGCSWEDSGTPDFTVPIAGYRIKPSPETFEAHGKTWTRHTPGDAMPCDGEAIIQCLFADGHVRYADLPAKVVRWSKIDSIADIIGWCYADEPTPEPLVTRPISSPINDGGPAFPKLGQVVNFGDGWIEPQSGMSLRDYFAGQAMTAIISSVYCTPETGFKEVSGKAYAQADAMLAAREVKP